MGISFQWIILPAVPSYFHCAPVKENYSHHWIKNVQAPDTALKGLERRRFQLKKTAFWAKKGAKLAAFMITLWLTAKN
jgi:hypothetical protein